MASEHTLKRFDEELERLNATINEMGGLTESQFSRALEAVREQDTALAEQVIADDTRVDALDAQVQTQTVQLLALRQPMAVDLRVVLSSIKIAAALERIADYAKNTAKRSIVLSQGSAPASAVTGIERVGRLVRTALKDVLDAFANDDVEKARSVWERDEEIDQVYTGLLLRCQSESQLAMVLGHEFGHYLRRHTLQRIRDGKEWQTVVALAGAGAANPMTGGVQQLTNMIASAAHSSCGSAR